MEVLLGEVVPIYFQLYDCASDQAILCRVRDAENTLLDTLEMTEVGDLGMYYNGDFQMPETDWITLQFVVYTNDTYTVLSPSEGAYAQTIMRKVTS